MSVVPISYCSPLVPYQIFCLQKDFGRLACLDAETCGSFFQPHLSIDLTPEEIYSCSSFRIPMKNSLMFLEREMESYLTLFTDHQKVENLFAVLCPGFSLHESTSCEYLIPQIMCHEGPKQGEAQYHFEAYLNREPPLFPSGTNCTHMVPSEAWESLVFEMENEFLPLLFEEHREEVDKRLRETCPGLPEPVPCQRIFYEGLCQWKDQLIEAPLIEFLDIYYDMPLSSFHCYQSRLPIRPTPLQKYLDLFEEPVREAIKVYVTTLCPQEDESDPLSDSPSLAYASTVSSLFLLGFFLWL